MRTLTAAVAVLAAVAAAPAARAQAKPSPTVEVLAMWNEAGRKLIAMAEDFPEAKYDYKPTPEVRSFAEQILHAAGANMAFVEFAQGKKPKEEDPPRAKYKTKAQVVAFLKQSLNEAAAFIQKTGDAGLMQAVKSPFEPNKMITPLAYWFDASSHMSEHYGQLVFYYRLNKLVPPESRPKK
jgi:hypothetical protein